MRHNQSKMQEPSLFALKLSGAFEIPPQTYRELDDTDTFMFVAVGHLMGESLDRHASGDVKWSGRLKVEDAARVDDPELRSRLYEQLGLAATQGTIDDVGQSGLFDDAGVQDHRGNGVPVGEHDDDVGSSDEEEPERVARPAPPPAQPSTTTGGSDPALDALRYGDEDLDGLIHTGREEQEGGRSSP